MNRLSGKVAIVTGAGRGIGRAIAEVFAQEGATVIATSQSAKHEFPAGIEYMQQEVAKEGDWKKVVDHVLSKHGRIDILVNNAGIIAYDPLTELSLKDWERVVGVNQTGVFLGMREVIPHMIKQGIGSVVNISSIWGSAAVAGAHAYHATKGAVRLFTKGVAMEVAPMRIRCNSVHPGIIETDMGRDLVSQFAAATGTGENDTRANFSNLHPLGHFGVPQNVADAVAFLASDRAAFMTGSELVVDGGFTAS
jgi:NAD(P)-dependent dehydrogenase (short-subunit alcohol dehydrogenase family)